MANPTKAAMMLAEGLDWLNDALIAALGILMIVFADGGSKMTEIGVLFLGVLAVLFAIQSGFSKMKVAKNYAIQKLLRLPNNIVALVLGVLFVMNTSLIAFPEMVHWIVGIAVAIIAVVTAIFEIIK